MNSFFNWINSQILYLFLVFLISLNLFPILAPILLHFEKIESSQAIYTIYSFFCHQQHWKSIHIHDHQVAWCTRDMFIWGSILITLIIVLFRKVRPLGFFWLVIYSIPMLLDGGLQTVAAIMGYSDSSAFYVSNNFFRMITGTIFGSGFGLYMFPRMKSLILQEQGMGVEKTSKLLMKGVNHLKIIVLILTIMFLIYIVLIQVWQITSIKYLPTNFLDTETKLPEDNRDWFLRRQTGV